MPIKKISTLPAGGTLDGTETVPMVQGGATKKSLLSAILTYIRTAFASTMMVFPRTTIAATGTNLATAAQLVASFCSVTAGDGTVGVKLPATPAAGTVVVVRNVSASALKVWPDAAATINAIGSHANIAMAANTSTIFWADSATQWYTLPLLPS